MSSKYPAKQHVANVLSKYESLHKSPVNFDILVCSEKRRLWPFSDQEVPFRQNRYFNYISGAYDIADAVVVYQTSENKLTLYLPDLDDEEAMWSGEPISLSQAMEKFDVDEVKYMSELKLHGNTRSIQPVDVKGVVFEAKLKDAFDEARVFKDEYEIGLIAKANEISSNCHIEVIGESRSYKSERDIHAEFIYHAIKQGGKNQSYDPICCAGPNAGTLHYVHNDQETESKSNVLIDAGAEYQCYASDITRCFPLHGRWTQRSLEIYQLVLKMQTKALEMVKPGVLWDDIHLEMHWILIEGFKKLNLFKPEFSNQEIFDSNVTVAFFPHGLGHMLGMDTHDVGGHANYEDTNPKFKYLRIRRSLEPGMVVTVEPGVYFNQLMLDQFIGTESKFLNYDIVFKYFEVGGVRIEDDVVVTADGYRNLTQVTSDPEEIIRLIK